jgi:hypothetical protein
MNTRLSLLFCATITIVLFSMTVLGAAPPSDSLDGKTFVAKTGEKGKHASNKDTIVFRDGRFLSEGCNKYGFGAAPYQATFDGDAVRFHAETHSPAHGDMVWDGIVKSDSIEATSIWTRKRWYWNIRKEYWYRGQLKE